MGINYELVGSKIRYYRMQKGLSQEELAESIDVSRAFIGYLERGEKIASIETLVNISNILDISTDSLLSSDLLTSAGADFTLFKDTSAEEKEIILQTVTSLKELLHKYRITK